MYADRFQAHIPHARKTLIEAAGHMLPYEQSDAFVEAVHGFWVNAQERVNCLCALHRLMVWSHCSLARGHHQVHIKADLSRLEVILWNLPYAKRSALV